MQADGGLVEDVADALQIGAELGGQAYALRFAAGQGGCRAIQLQVAQAHVAEKRGAGGEFRHQIAGDVALAADQLDLGHGGLEFLHRQVGQRRDRQAAKQHVTRHGIEALAPAIETGQVGRTFGLAPLRFFAALLGIELRHLQTGAETGLAPAVARIERKQAWIEFGEAGAAIGAGALGGKYSGCRTGSGRPGGGRCVDGRCPGAPRLACGRVIGGRPTAGLRFVGAGGSDMHHAASVLQGRLQRLAQFRFAGGIHGQRGHGQFDAVLDESVEPRPFGGGQQRAVDTQFRIALAAGPLRERGVESLARDDERRQQGDLLAAVVLEDARGDGVGRLRLDGGVTGRTVLRAQLDVQQAQEMVDLGERGHRALAAAAAGPLFDRHGRRDAEDGVHVGARCGLHELAGIGVERLEIAPLPFGEQDIECQAALAAARDAGHHGELIALQVDVDVLEVVLAGAADLDGVGRCRTVREALRVLDAGGEGRGMLGLDQRPSGVRGAHTHDIRRCADAHHRAAAIAALRA